MTQPLEGVRVLDLTRLLPGAVTTMMLVDLGAEVIKIEDPNGGDYARWMPPHIDEQSVFFRMNNRGKRSVILNLKESAGQAVLKRMVAQADVLIEGFRPAVMTRLGCDYEVLRAINPKLVYCSLSGWGVDGPYAALGGHDLNYVAAAGIAGQMETPQVLGGQIADIGGAYIAFSGILAALFRRERTGAGAYIDTSLAESGLPFALYNWVESRSLGAGPGMGGLTGLLGYYRIYPTKGGGHVSLGALESKFFSNFCQAVGRMDLMEMHERYDRQMELRAALEALFMQKSAAEWEAQLKDADCCFMRVRTADEIDQDPHFQARGMLGTFADGTPWMRSPVRVSESDPVIENRVPGYGEHTAQVLAEFGYSADEIEALKASAIIR